MHVIQNIYKYHCEENIVSERLIENVKFSVLHKRHVLRNAGYTLPLTFGAPALRAHFGQ